MFPNFRLLIAAIAACVIALICGFAVFAAFRVNHAPLARLSPATAALQIAAENASAGPSSDHRPQIGEGQSAPAAASAGATSPSQEAQAPQAERDTKPDGVTGTIDQGEPAAPPAIAAIETPTEQTQAAKPIAPETELAPASSRSEPATAPPATPGKIVRRKHPRPHVARAYHGRRAHAAALTRSVRQNFAFPEPHFISAPPPWPGDTAQISPAKIRRAPSPVGGPFVGPTSQ